MNDFFAAFPAWRGEQIRALAIRPPGGSAPAAIALLAQSIVLEESKIQGAELHAQLLRSPAYQAHLRTSRELLERLGLLPPERVDLSRLPSRSFYLRMDFRLEMPYMSRDDRAFSITENPVRKDRVFEVPMVSPSTWKGALKNACRMAGDETRLTALFGTAPSGPEVDDGATEAAEEDSAAKGSLHFYPSFFGGVGLETINPHDRKTRTGKNPIRIECVPKGSGSTFAMLYAPILPPVVEDAAADVRLVTSACQAMLMDFGFAAKKSSGYGAASAQLGKQGGRLLMEGVPGWNPEFATLDELHRKGEELAARLEDTT